MENREFQILSEEEIQELLQEIEQMQKEEQRIQEEAQKLQEEEQDVNSRKRRLLSEEEIQELLQEIEQMQKEEQRIQEEEQNLKLQQLKLFGKSPNEIRKIPVLHDRNAELAKFELLNQLYVLPLFEYAKRVSGNPKLSFKDSDELSIYHRCQILQQYIKQKAAEKGKKFTEIDLHRLIPTTEKDIDYLVRAKRIGFDLGLEKQEYLENNVRVFLARQRLKEKNMLPEEKFANQNFQFKQRTLNQSSEQSSNGSHYGRRK